MSETDFIDQADLNQEKKQAIKHNDSTIVIANPGTGKTLLLAYKYVYLLYQGIDPKDILCLTFTEKACQEMQQRIIKLIEKEQIMVDISQINIQTFHAFSLDNLEENEIISSNLLRYEIYSYLIENEVLNYSDQYLLTEIVPKIEDAIRNLKCYGIKPKDIDLLKVKKHIQEFKKYTKEELENYLEHFVKIFHKYEEYKQKKGLDYADLLINFFEQKIKPKFKWVLVDELQDVNNIEADIALSVCEKYLVVGDKKQAIFGFQGGSINNFNKFNNAKEFILSINFRSTDDILEYAKELYSKNIENKEELREIQNLKSEKALKGKKPIIIQIKEDSEKIVCDYIKKLQTEDKEIAIITRTNSYLLKIAKELDANSISYSSTYLTSSKEARKEIITFLKGLLSKDLNLIKKAMFTPFFPINLQDAFELSENYDLTLEEIYTKAPAFKKIRETINNINDLDKIFKEIILPVAVAYGKDYTLSCVNMQNATIEALEILENKTIENLCNYLESAEQLAQDIGEDKKVILTTVHKAKGRQFDIAIYVPTSTRNRESFQDNIKNAILKSKDQNPKEEIEKESKRIDFVAVTRAKEQLFIITDKSEEYYLPIKSELQEPLLLDLEKQEFNDINKKAFSLFINKEYDNAKEILENKNKWLIDFIKKHFENLKHLSFSSIDTNPIRYLEQNILKLRTSNKSLTKGSLVHELIDKMLKGEEIDYKDLSVENQEILDNTKDLILSIREKYSEIVSSEYSFREIPLKKITDTNTDLTIKGKIDAIFKDPKREEYLIVDWKTDRDPTSYASEHRQQLELYKNIYCYENNILPEKVKVCIGYVCFKKTINDGKIYQTLDYKQPVRSAILTLTKKIQKICSWREDVDLYFRDLEEKIADPSNQDPLVRSVVELYLLEKG